MYHQAPFQKGLVFYRSFNF